ncbi:MAG: hypothetical protein EHM72_05610, partial [Calditrichaeota bacterium]
WNSPNTGATNGSGFSALPGGYRYLYGYFYALGDYADFWSSTEYGSDNAWTRYLGCDDSRVFRYSIPKDYGHSVRCVRD